MQEREKAFSNIIKLFFFGGGVLRQGGLELIKTNKYTTCKIEKKIENLDRDFNFFNLKHIKTLYH